MTEPTRDLGEAITRHDEATTALRTITAALNMIPSLIAEVRNLRGRLARTLADLHNLIAAARATLSAHNDGEADPLYYLRDELHAQHRDHGRRS
jgi:hypothetical protein